ncbi:hypothetical protein ARAM_005675 [Aspergillus rambellii]|uniref:Zn(2)-C6 fungal-type domain-containing protein n=1 Tax=Aspergillus rambellii TaxID=308745 RepID=A0A0F8V5H4_9EURO|nr:hypothetical protein ARAM_005675 [Aspergillus rambellii]
MSAVCPPVSSQTTQLPTHGMIKLRGSCHACAVSKLKCSQDKPTCVRCAKRGTACQYLASKRAGRKHGSRASSVRNPLRTNRNADPAGRDGGGDVLAAPMQFMQYALQQDRNLEGLQEQDDPKSTCHDSLSSAKSSSAPTASVTSPLSFPVDLDSFLGSPMSLSLLDGPEPQYFGASEIDIRDFGRFFDPDSCLISDNLHAAAHDERRVTKPPTPDALIPPPSGVSDSDTFAQRFQNSPKSDASYLQCFCLVRSLGVLKDLFPTSLEGCTTASLDDQESANQIPTIQEVITKNEQAIWEISQLLECDCSQDGYILMVLTLAALKVLAWYRAAAAQDPPLFEDRQHWGRRPPPEQVVRAPAVIRNYHVDGEDQGRMAAQLVLSELHGVQRLVNTLYQRLKEQGMRDVQLATPEDITAEGRDFLSERADPSPVPVSLLDRLATDLRTGLRSLSAEIVGALRRG